MEEDRARLEEAIGEELAELQAAYEDSDRALADQLGVGRTDLRCLDLITRAGPHTAGQIAAALHLTPGSVTALVDRLERAGYARRHPDPQHGKRVLVAPTDKLARAITPIVSRRAEQGRQRLAGYTTDQLALIRDFLRATRVGHIASGASPSRPEVSGGSSDTDVGAEIRR